MSYDGGDVTETYLSQEGVSRSKRVLLYSGNLRPKGRDEHDEDDNVDERGRAEPDCAGNVDGDGLRRSFASEGGLGTGEVNVRTAIW